MAAVPEVLFEAIRAVLRRSNAEAAFAAFCQTELAAVEDSYLYFRPSAGLAAGGYLTMEDRKILAQVVSGFANTGGGIVLWGVSRAAQTRETALVPIAEIESFGTKVVELAGRATAPVVEGIALEQFRRADGSGYAVLLVPESDLPPHQIILGVDGKDKYYGRVGAALEPLPHNLLEDKFGRRPHPKLVLTATQLHVAAADGAGNPLDWEIDLHLHNRGRGAARELAFTLAASGLSSRRGSVHADPYAWTRAFTDIEGNAIYAPSALRMLPAGASVKLEGLTFREFEKGESVQIRVRLFADGVAPKDWTWKLTA